MNEWMKQVSIGSIGGAEGIRREDWTKGCVLQMHSYFQSQHSLTLNSTHVDTSLNLKKKGVCEDLALCVGR